VLEDGSVGEAECRANITHRNFSCYEEVCDQCTAQCTYPTANSVASVLKCTVARGQLAFTNCKQYNSNLLTCTPHYKRNPAYTPSRLLYRFADDRRRTTRTREPWSCSER